MTAAACRDMVEYWATDTTTTMGEAPQCEVNARTAEPIPRESARPRAVRTPGDRGRYVAWTQIRGSYDVYSTLYYDLELVPADESLLLGETEWIASIPLPEHGFPLVFVCGARTEPARQSRTELWRRLMEIRSRAVAAGTPLLDWDDLERELKSRRSRELPGASA
jgi:hypothetical protein